MSDPSLQQIQLALDSARRELLKLDAQLISQQAHERTIAAHFCDYLRPHFPGFYVDCEYNRLGEGKDSKVDSSGAKIFPDIVIHQRGVDDGNLVVIEFKPRTASKRRFSSDRAKLREMLLEPRQYSYAFLAIYDGDPIPNLEFESIFLHGSYQ